MSTHPSIVMHWNTVRTAKRMLSKLVMPKLGPVQYSLQVVPLAQVLAGASRPQGKSAACSSTAADTHQHTHRHSAPVLIEKAGMHYVKVPLR